MQNEIKVININDDTSDEELEQAAAMMAPVFYEPDTQPKNRAERRKARKKAGKKGRKFIDIEITKEGPYG